MSERLCLEATMGSVSALRLCPHASLSTEELLNGKRNKHLSPVTGRQGETFFQPACPLSYSISLLPGIAFEARRGVNDFLDLSKVKERLFLWVQLWRVTVNLGYALRYGIRLLLLLLLPLLLRQLHCRLLSMIRHGTIKKIPYPRPCESILCAGTAIWNLPAEMAETIGAQESVS